MNPRLSSNHHHAYHGDRSHAVITVAEDVLVWEPANHPGTGHRWKRCEVARKACVRNINVHVVSHMTGFDHTVVPGVIVPCSAADIAVRRKANAAAWSCS